METIDAIKNRQWAPDSWRKQESLQMATYDDQVAYGAVINKLSKVPPLVQAAEVDALTRLLAAAGRGERFIIQGGDCAERFVDCEAERLEAQTKLVVQMGAIFEKATNVPAVLIARLAGQYGKPRSKPTETVAGVGEVYSFKGDNINGYEIADRQWDPKRLLDGYWHSSATFNFVRSMQMGDDFDARMLGTLPEGERPHITFLTSTPQAEEIAAEHAGLADEIAPFANAASLNLDFVYPATQLPEAPFGAPWAGWIPD